MTMRKLSYRILPGEKVDVGEVQTYRIKCPDGHIFESWDKNSKICRECRNEKAKKYTKDWYERGREKLLRDHT